MNAPNLSQHPNASVAGAGGGAGVFIVWLLGSVFHVSISAEEGALIASGIGTVLLVIGRKGLKGIVAQIWRGSGK